MKVLRITPKTPYPNLNSWLIPNLKTHETGTTEFQIVPHTRNEQDVPVYYDNRDGLYIRADNFKLKTDEDFVILYGVDHVQTGFATFFNISFYGEEYWNGVVGANITDESKYPATEYFPKDYNNSKYYYAVKMAGKNTMLKHSCSKVPLHSTVISCQYTILCN